MSRKTSAGYRIEALAQAIGMCTSPEEIGEGAASAARDMSREAQSELVMALAKVAVQFATGDDLTRMTAEIDGEFARMRGEGLCVCDRGIDVETIPSGGATLTVYWCTDPGASVTWYPYDVDAMNALHALAKHEGRVVEGRSVDLTREGCLSSYASVQVRP